MEGINSLETIESMNEDIFVEYINQYKNELYKIAFIYTKEEHSALEVMDETIYKAYRNMSKLKYAKYFKTWIIRILINECKDYIRKNKKIIPIEEVATDSTNESISESKLDLIRALDMINKKHRDVIILRYYEDLKVEDIAQIIDRPLGTVKTYIHRGLKELRGILKEDYFNE